MLKCKKILSLIMVFAMLSAVIALSAVAVHAEDKNPNTDPTVSVQQGQDPSEDEDIDDSDYDDEYIDDEDFYGRPEGVLPYANYLFSVAANGVGTATATVDGETFTGTRKVGKRQDQIDNLIVTLTASSDSGTFIDWTITGSFIVVSGGMDEKVITIRPDSDIRAVANFSDKSELGESGKGTAGTATPDESKTNNGKTSPKTADPTPMVVLMLGLAVATGVLAVKKLKES
nr:hypothetical protein [uncultured Ruminococcus sp.]